MKDQSLKQARRYEQEADGLRAGVERLQETMQRQAAEAEDRGREAARLSGLLEGSLQQLTQQLERAMQETRPAWSRRMPLTGWFCRRTSAWVFSPGPNLVLHFGLIS